MTQQDSPSDPAPDQVPAEPQPLEYRSPVPQTSASADSPTWFGYIGLGIAIFSLLIGVAGMMFAIIWFIGWTRS